MSTRHNRKRGEAIELMRLAIVDATASGTPITVPMLQRATGINKSQCFMAVKRMTTSGELERIAFGIYKAAGAGIGDAGRTAQPTQAVSPLAALTSQLESIPTTIAAVIESVVELLVEPEAEILAALDRSTKRINDLEVLLHGARLESGNARAKIQELTSKINKLATQKNRVIPETKVVYR